MADTPTVLTLRSSGWAKWNEAVEAAIDGLRPPPPHRCGDWCRPYTGPVIQGRRDARGRPVETITARCTTCRRWVPPDDLAQGECGHCWDTDDRRYERRQDR